MRYSLDQVWGDPEKKEEFLQKARETRIRKKKEKAVREMQEKVIKDMLIERISQEDWDEMLGGLINRAKNIDNSFVILRDTIGQKPVDKQEIAASADIEINIL